jgi:hypothetical protein
MAQSARTAAMLNQDRPSTVRTANGTVTAPCQPSSGVARHFRHRRRRSRLPSRRAAMRASRTAASRRPVPAIGHPRPSLTCDRFVADQKSWPGEEPLSVRPKRNLRRAAGQSLQSCLPRAARRQRRPEITSTAVRGPSVGANAAAYSWAAAGPMPGRNGRAGAVIGARRSAALHQALRDCTRSTSHGSANQLVSGRLGEPSNMQVTRHNALG